MMTIRKVLETDYDKIWEIFSAVIKTGDTYVFDPDTPKSDLKKHWLADGMDTFVAIEEDEIIGTYFIKPNQIGLGNHIANCGYMVNPKYQGKGIGQKLCLHSLEYAKERQYIAIQFNIVVSTNIKAVRLWQKCGFSIVGATPKGFRHQSLGLVDTFIMYKALE